MSFLVTGRHKGAALGRGKRWHTPVSPKAMGPLFATAMCIRPVARGCLAVIYQPKKETVLFKIGLYQDTS